jgi:hypothetical protein
VVVGGDQKILVRSWKVEKETEEGVVDGG